MTSLLQTPADVLRFWFGACPLEAAAMQRVQGQWFKKDDAFDAALRQRFAATIDTALKGGLADWSGDPHGRLALIVVLDQFTRNAFRGQPASFSGDARALALALEGIERGDDQAIAPLARGFCYLPLEHAEDAALQAQSVALFERLAAAPDAEPAPYFAVTLDFARRHQAVIDRFGRFPHRNAILGRTSTREELDYLAQPGSGF